MEKGKRMIKLSLWESLVISMAVSFLTALDATITNTVVKDGLAGALLFLQQLLSGTTPAA
jgi:hypothetical protein